jgi:hypothetical protein
MKEPEAGHEKTKSVRFTALVARAGKPKVYLPFSDPKHDRSFMHAVKENRVLTIRQEPTATHADFGIVGYDEQKSATYLIFPKSLAAFSDARVIGIKYDVLEDASFVASPAPRLSKEQKQQLKESRATTPKLRVELERKPPAPPKAVEPQPKEFRVRVRVTTVTEKDVTVSAMTKAEAKHKAQAAVESEGDVRAINVTEV